MTSRSDPKTLLWDAHRAGDRIAQFTTGKSFDDDLDDIMLRSTVERRFEIMGEALNILRRNDADLAREIIDLPSIVAFRNVLIHGYAAVNHRLVWDVVQDELPGTLSVLARLLSDPEPPDARLPPRARSNHQS